MSEILHIRWRIFFILTKSQKWGFYSQKTLLLKGAKNHRVKKVIKSKNDWSKSYSKFCKLGDKFFLFWRNLKNEDSTAKKRSLKDAKNHRVKEVIKSKNDLSKSCSKFCKLGDEFFSFWRNLKNEVATAEKTIVW